MKLYHGSSTGGLTVLEPRLADHERPYVYLSTIPEVAGFYLANAVERPYYWFPYGFYKKYGQIPVYHELWPDALSEVSRGKSGWIYEVQAEETQVIPFGENPCARLGTAPIPVTGSVFVPDSYQWFQEAERAGRIVIIHFEQFSPQGLSWWYNDILNECRKKGLIHKPECSYARLVREKFPQVWAALERGDDCVSPADVIK